MRGTVVYENNNNNNNNNNNSNNNNKIIRNWSSIKSRIKENESLMSLFFRKYHIE